MKAKTVMILALLGLGLLAAGGASRNQSKATFVVREQANGEWQIFIFGAPVCTQKQNFQYIWPTDPETQPIELECDNVVPQGGSN